MDARMIARIQKLQKEMQKKQEEFNQKEFEVDYKNGAIVINLMGDKKLIKIKINEALIDPTDPITLQEMVVEAVNQAMDAIDEKQNEMIPELNGLSGMGGMF